MKHVTEYASNLNGVAAYCYDSWVSLKGLYDGLSEDADRSVVEGQMKGYWSVLHLITGRNKLADIAEILRSMGLDVQDSDA